MKKEEKREGKGRGKGRNWKGPEKGRVKGKGKWKVYKRKRLFFLPSLLMACFLFILYRYSFKESRQGI